VTNLPLAPIQALDCHCAFADQILVSDSVSRTRTWALHGRPQTCIRGIAVRQDWKREV